MHSDQELNYLTKSLLHHPSPYIIYELDGSIAWANLAANYIFNLSSLDEISVIKIDDQVKNNFGDLESIALYYDTPIEISLRKINFLMRTRVHMIPVDESNGIMLIELFGDTRPFLEQSSSASVIMKSPNEINPNGTACVVYEAVGDIEGISFMLNADENMSSTQQRVSAGWHSECFASTGLLSTDFVLDISWNGEQKPAQRWLNPLGISGRSDALLDRTGIRLHWLEFKP